MTVPEGIARLDVGQAFELYCDSSIHELGRLAHAVTQRLHPEPYRTYVVDRNINYANYCTARCIFCTFKADTPGVDTGRKKLPGRDGLSFEQIGEKNKGLLASGREAVA